MKRVLLSIIVLFGVTTLASAQRIKKYNSSTTKTVRDTLATTRRTTNTSVKFNSDTPTLTNRNIYHWSDGQRSTPTGHEATSSNGSAYAALKKDTAKVTGNSKQQ